MKLNLLLCSLLISLCFACSKTEHTINAALSSQEIACTDRDSPRIESTKNGFQSYNQQTSAITFDDNQMETEIERYWGNNKEKKFDISIQSAQRLLNLSDSGEISLKLNNSEDAANVSGQFIPFSSVEANSELGCTSYFSIDKRLMNEFSKLSNKISVRVGRTEAEVISVFFIVSGNSRGGGATSGAKLPRDQ